MAGIVVLLLIGLQVLLALMYPVLLVDLSLLTGIWPLSFGQDDMLMTAFGRFDLSSLRLLGLWVAVTLVILLRLDRSWHYLNRFRWHLFFLIFCMMALIWSPSLTYGVRMLAKLSAPFLFLIFVLAVITTRNQLKRMETLMLIAGVSMLILAGVSKLMGWGHNPVGLTIPFTGPALFSGFLVTVSMLTLSRAKYKNRPLNVLLFLLFTAGVLAAFTRITIAALFISASLVMFYAVKGLPRVMFPTLGLIGFPALFLFNETFKNRMFYGADHMSVNTFLSNPEQAVGHLYGSGRFAAWPKILANFFDPSPIVGSGIGATQNFYYSQVGRGLGVVHSEYVRLLAEVGAFGLALFVAAVFVYIYRMLNAYQRAPKSDTGKYSLAALGGLVAYLIFMATDNAFDYVNGFGIYVFGLIAMSEKARELDAAEAKPSSLMVPVASHTNRHRVIGGVEKCRL
jgi:O-antigen ligase